MLRYGIDVSKHQGNVDWSKVKASGKVEFAILRAGIGTAKDIRFEAYYQGAKENNIPVGAYWYSYAVTTAQAVQEAEAFLNVVKGKQFAYPLYFDLEEPKQFALGRNQCSEVAKAFLNTLEKAGYFAGLYASKSHLEDYVTQEVRNRYAVWVAHYGVKQTTYSGSYGMWQYSDKGTVSGIPDNQVDFDICYTDYPTVIKNAGLNGFEKTAVPAEPSKEKKQFSVTVDGKTYSGELEEN